MNFLIADTFTDSLARLSADEQKAVKTTAFDLQMNPARPGLSFHKLDKAKDTNFWSVRVTADIRIIVHKTTGSLLLCYVDHHDKAYNWAERRKLEIHPKTGAAQLVEIRSDSISVFNGPAPTIRVVRNEAEEAEAVGAWLSEQAKAGVQPHEFGVFVRSTGQLGRAQAAVKKAGLPFNILDERVETTSGDVSISTMHLAKGLEFRSVAVMACDDEIIPLQERIETVGDDADLQEVYDTERHLLYVACTRARDHLFITGVEPASEFLDDLKT
jgi:mRNA-degrading endonuclease RelE of RelBE toxin-antitoxin system